MNIKCEHAPKNKPIVCKCVDEEIASLKIKLKEWDDKSRHIHCMYCGQDNEYNIGEDKKVFQERLFKHSVECEKRPEKRMAEKMLTLIEELTRLRACLELAEGALESAAKTAHYRQNNFCNGDFEDCVNCGKWRKALSEAEKNMGVK